jgi:hypothetical protein
MLESEEAYIEAVMREYPVESCGRG